MTTPLMNVKNQVAPCGITCGTCELGNGTVAKTANEMIEQINRIGIKEWAPGVPGGAELDWEMTEKTLNWMTTYAHCAGCEKGGGPPDCAIRACALEKGFTLCNQCSEREECDKFDWLGDYAAVLKEKLVDYRGKTKEQIVSEALGES